MRSLETFCFRKKRTNPGLNILPDSWKRCKNVTKVSFPLRSGPSLEAWTNSRSLKPTTSCSLDTRTVLCVSGTLREWRCPTSTPSTRPTSLCLRTGSPLWKKRSGHPSGRYCYNLLSKMNVLKYWFLSPNSTLILTGSLSNSVQVSYWTHSKHIFKYKLFIVFFKDSTMNFIFWWCLTFCGFFVLNKKPATPIFNEIHGNLALKKRSPKATMACASIIVIKKTNFHQEIFYL